MLVVERFVEVLGESDNLRLCSLFLVGIVMGIMWHVIRSLWNISFFLQVVFSSVIAVCMCVQVNPDEFSAPPNAALEVLLQ